MPEAGPSAGQEPEDSLTAMEQQLQHVRNLVDEFKARYKRATSAYEVAGLSREIVNDSIERRTELIKSAKRKWSALHSDRLGNLVNAKLAAEARGCLAIVNGAITWIEENAFVDEAERRKITEYNKPSLNLNPLEAEKGDNKARSFPEDRPIKIDKQIPTAELEVGDCLMLRTNSGSAYICTVVSIRNQKPFIQFVAGGLSFLGSEGSLSDRFIGLTRPLRFRLESGESKQTLPIVELIISKHLYGGWVGVGEGEGEEEQQRASEYQNALQEISEADTFLQLKSKLETLRSKGFSYIVDPPNGVFVDVASQLTALDELEKSIFEEHSWAKVDQLLRKLTPLGKIRKNAQTLSEELFKIANELRLSRDLSDVFFLLSALHLKGQEQLIDFDGSTASILEMILLLRSLRSFFSPTAEDTLREVAQLPARFGIRQKTANYLAERKRIDEHGNRLFEMRPYDVELTSLNASSLLPGEYLIVTTSDGSRHTFQVLRVLNDSLPVIRHHASDSSAKITSFEGLESPLLESELVVGRELPLVGAQGLLLSSIQVSLVPPSDAV